MQKRSSIKTLRQGDPKFRITDGIITTPRAGFELSKSCPDEYRSLLMQAINAGWIKPVAHVKEEEFMWEILCDGV